VHFAASPSDNDAVRETLAIADYPPLEPIVEIQSPKLSLAPRKRAGIAPISGRHFPSVAERLK